MRYIREYIRSHIRHFSLRGFAISGAAAVAGVVTGAYLGPHIGLTIAMGAAVGASVIGGGTTLLRGMMMQKKAPPAKNFWQKAGRIALAYAPGSLAVNWNEPFARCNPTSARTALASFLPTARSASIASAVGLASVRPLRSWK